MPPPTAKQAFARHLLDHQDVAKMPNLAEMGRQAGLSRERMRQAAKAFAITGKGMSEARYKAKPLPAGKYLTQLVNLWLALIEHKYCSVCHQAKPFCEMTKLKVGYHGRCKQCSSQRTSRWYASANGRAKAEQWRRNNPERVRKYWMEYEARQRMPT